MRRPTSLDGIAHFMTVGGWCAPPAVAQARPGIRLVLQMREARIARLHSYPTATRGKPTAPSGVTLSSCFDKRASSFQ